MTFTAAVVGCGRIGSAYDEGRYGDPRSHAGAYRASTAVRLVAGVDPDERQREAFVRRWDVPAFPTIDAMLARVRPDLWSICTPQHGRLEIVRAAITGGAKAIWCEKPLAESVAAASEIARIVKRARVPLVLDHQRRWDGGHRAVAAWVRSGRFGSLEHGVVHYTRGLRNYGTHAIDLLRWFLGEPSWTRAVPCHDSGSPDPSPCALLGYPGGGAVAFLPVRTASYNVFEVDLFGSRGRVTLSDLGRKIDVREVVPLRGWSGERTLGRRAGATRPAGGLRGLLRAALADVVAAVRTGSRPACGADDGVAALRVAEGIERAALTGEMIRLDRPERR